jgi:hypothetical protein
MKALVCMTFILTMTACVSLPEIPTSSQVRTTIQCAETNSRRKQLPPIEEDPSAKSRAASRLEHAVHLITDSYKQRYNKRHIEKRAIQVLSKKPGLSATEKATLDKALERLEKEDLLDYYELIKILNHLDGLHNMDWP